MSRWIGGCGLVSAARTTQRCLEGPRRLGRSFLPRVLVDGDRERGRSVSEDGRDDHRVHTSAAKLRGHRVANVVHALYEREAAGGVVVKEAAGAPWGYFGYFGDPDGYLWKVASSSS